jgi:hypothetical protein
MSSTNIEYWTSRAKAPTPDELQKATDCFLNGDNAPLAVKQHRDILKELNELYAKKNADYGDSFHASYLEWGLTMSAIRLGDKYNRFCNLIKNPQKVTDESIRDTLIDLANYAIMTVMEMDGR